MHGLRHNGADLHIVWFEPLSHDFSDDITGGHDAEAGIAVLHQQTGNPFPIEKQGRFTHRDIPGNLYDAGGHHMSDHRG